jgi:hypothetical protein
MNSPFFNLHEIQITKLINHWSWFGCEDICSRFLCIVDFFVHATITYWNEVKYHCKTTTNLIVSNPFWKKVYLIKQKQKKKKNTRTKIIRVTKTNAILLFK